MEKQFIKIGKFILYPLALLGIIDFMLQMFTNGEFRLIHKILASTFGG